MTWARVQNRNNKLAEDKLTTYFGDSGWKKLRTQDDFVVLRKNPKITISSQIQAFTIAVIQEGGKRYDVILATQSSGGANVLNDLKKVVDSVNTETIIFMTTTAARLESSQFFIQKKVMLF